MSDYTTEVEAYKRQAKIYNKWIEDLQDLIYEVACAGVVSDDPRLGYVEIQIDPITWSDLQQFKANYKKNVESRKM